MFIKRGLIFWGCMWCTTTLLAHDNPGYLHDSSIGYTSDSWMGHIDDNVQINMMSIPGTHDTMADIGSVGVRTQTLDLPTQLNAGIRALDIRLKCVNNQLDAYHGPAYLDANFDNVLTDTTQFLSNHASEFVLMRIKQEGDPDNCSKSFAEVVDDYIADPNYASYFINNSVSKSAHISSVRGKIVVMKNYEEQVQDLGILWADKSNITLPGELNIQDEYEMSSKSDQYNKWMYVKSKLIESSDLTNPDLFVNFLSAAPPLDSYIIAGTTTVLLGGVGALAWADMPWPYFVASGHTSEGTSASRQSTGWLDSFGNNSGKYPDFPRVNCFLGTCTIAYEGTNTLAMDYIYTKAVKRTGIVFADFPGKGLINSIILKNFDAPVFIKNQGNNSIYQCLDTSGSTATGAQAHLWDCGISNVNQYWILDTMGSIHASIDFDQCLSTTNHQTSAGTAVTFEDCATAMKWEKRADLTIRPKTAQNMCLATQNNGNSFGTKIVLAACDGSQATQQWEWFYSVDDTHGDQCLDTGGSALSGEDATLFLCAIDNINQYWSFDNSGKINSYMGSDLCLETENHSLQNNATVQLTACSNGMQWWTFDDKTIRPDGDLSKCLQQMPSAPEVQLQNCSAATELQWSGLPTTRWHYEAEQGAPIYHAVGRQDGDGWSANTADDNAGTLLFGPYQQIFGVGNKTISFSTLVDNVTAGGDVAHIDVYDATTGQIVQSRAVPRSEFAQPFVYQNVQMDFNLDGRQGHKMEFRMYWTDISYVKVESYEVVDRR